jgi:hypothetical protein
MAAIVTIKSIIVEASFKNIRLDWEGFEAEKLSSLFGKGPVL